MKIDFNNIPKVLDSHLRENDVNGRSEYRFVFVNGEYQSDLSHVVDLSNYITIDKETFTLHFPKDFCAKQPIHLMHINKAPGAQSFCHNIIADENSDAVIIESYRSEDSFEYSNDVETRINLKNSARIHYYKWQSESEKAMHTGRFSAEQSQDSYLGTYHVVMGARVSSDQFSYSLSGEGATCESIGFYRADQKQQIQVNSRIHHLSSHTNSRQFYKGMADDQAHAAFFGKVLVDPGIKDVCAHQKNDNLLLSSHAEVDTRPELEIYSDDVRCSHGATVGQIDKDALFYLRSRGLSEHEAKRLMIYGFINEVLELLPNATIASKIKRQLINRLLSI